MAKHSQALADKLREQQNPKEQSSKEPQVDQEKEFLKAQVASLQEQLQRSDRASEEAKLEREAERLQQEQDALREEADLRKTLKDMLPPQQTDELGQPRELSQNELIGVMAEAVGKATEAQGKLIMGEVSKLVRGTDDKVVRTQKALIDMMAMIDVGRARSQFSDFDAYKEDVSEIMGRTNLDTTEAYLLAKAKKESLTPPGSPASERPSQPPAIGPREPSACSEREEERYPEIRNPRAEFQQAASDAIDKILAARR